MIDRPFLRLQESDPNFLEYQMDPEEAFTVGLDIIDQGNEAKSNRLAFPSYTLIRIPNPTCSVLLVVIFLNRIANPSCPVEPSILNKNRPRSNPTKKARDFLREIVHDQTVIQSASADYLSPIQEATSSVK